MLYDTPKPPMPSGWMKRQERRNSRDFAVLGVVFVMCWFNGFFFLFLFFFFVLALLAFLLTCFVFFHEGVTTGVRGNMGGPGGEQN